MKVLVDTHALLWFVLDDPRLGRKADALMRSGSTDLLLSVASCWELAIKHALGKINLGKPFDQFLWPELRRNQIEVLPIAEAHLNLLSGLPNHHRDPFDRLLAAQALAERIPMVSADEAMSRYGVELIW